VTSGNKGLVLDALGAARGPLCDDCLAKTAGVHPRQTVFQLCTSLAAANRIVRERRACGICGRTKNTSVVRAAGATQSPLAVRAAALGSGSPRGEDVAEDRHRAVLLHDDASDTRPWHWEGHVQDALGVFLVTEGWSVTQKADTASKEPGIDIVATKDRRWLAIEVKGYPSTTYEYGPRRGEPKPTSPSNQARQWFSHALLSMMLLRHKRPDAEIALCFPDFATYRRLAAGTRTCFDLLGFGIYFVAQDRRVVLALPHAPVQLLAAAASSSSEGS